MSQSSTQSSNSGDRDGVANLADCVKPLLLSAELSDVQFSVGRDYGTAQIFPAHRLIMSIRSDVFCTMFYGSIPENCTAPIDLPDIHPEAFTNMLCFMYTDAVPHLSADNVFATIASADKYNLPLLVANCIRFVLENLSINNCLDILDKARHYTLTAPSIQEECLRLIDESAETVWQSDEFSAIGQETLQIILGRGSLTADEAVICSAVDKWATKMCSDHNVDGSPVNRREMLGPALHLVRFPLLTCAQLLEGPVKTGLLLQSELLDIIHYKHGPGKPQLPFLTEARQNGRAEGVINYTVPDVRKLTEATPLLSDPIAVRKLPWRIMVMQWSQFGPSWMSYFLKCGANPKSTCAVNGELRLLPWKAEISPFKRTISTTFPNNENDWGFRNYILMEDLLDPAKGYVNPNTFSVKLQLQLSADLPVEIE